MPVFPEADSLSNSSVPAVVVDQKQVDSPLSSAPAPAENASSVNDNADAAKSNPSGNESDDESEAVSKFSLLDTEWLKLLESKTGIPRLYLAVGIFAICLGIVLYAFGLHAFSHFVAFVYPAYKSFKTLEDPTAREERLHWLTYWVVYGFFVVSEFVADRILFWIPYYSLLKLIFLVTCFLPQTNLSTVVYAKVVKPLFKSNEQRIESAFETSASLALQVWSEVRSIASDIASAAMSQVSASFLANLFVSAQQRRDSVSAPEDEKKEERRDAKKVQ